MKGSAYSPAQVIPRPLAKAVRALPYWFVIGGQAVRCFAPYRPSRDVDFGVGEPATLDELVEALRRGGAVEIQEASRDTVHLTWNGIKVSIFVLAKLVPFVEDQHLDVRGILATKLHAILDRGLRRDFFDLYVMLEQQRLGIAECLAAMRQVHETPVADGLLLRALTFFDDAEREAPLPSEGRSDWDTVKRFFMERAGNLLLPPAKRLSIQARVVDVTPGGGGKAPPRRRRRGSV